ncbi:hypothetical protein DFH08DRAFT_802107 [Mycena albidolilacea]|uniref:Uncharacterized protein n=1 Tax=Mycena albidolilacea TaxID=1033008 RepID=A0AAD7EZD9_9AGAR|nr:hypothetical protein DFH08DRAFT_802107 [Mycena albidolilacea]
MCNDDEVGSRELEVTGSGKGLKRRCRKLYATAVKGGPGTGQRQEEGVVVGGIGTGDLWGAGRKRSGCSGQGMPYALRFIEGIAGGGGGGVAVGGRRKREGRHLFGAHLSSASVSSSARKPSAGSSALPKKDQERRRTPCIGYQKTLQWLQMTYTQSLGSPQLEILSGWAIFNVMAPLGSGCKPLSVIGSCMSSVTQPLKCP